MRKRIYWTIFGAGVPVLIVLVAVNFSFLVGWTLGVSLFFALWVWFAPWWKKT